MTKNRNENYMTNLIDAVYAKNETKLLWLIEPGSSVIKTR